MVGSIITFTNKDSLYIFLQLGQMHYILKEWFNNWGKKICVVFLTELDEKTDTTLMCVIYEASAGTDCLLCRQPIILKPQWSEKCPTGQKSHLSDSLLRQSKA